MVMAASFCPPPRRRCWTTTTAIRATATILMRRCGGRTAHKGARHGLKASAKLERIERQEGSAKASPALSPVPSPLTVHAASPTVDESTPVSTKKEKKKRKKRSVEAESASVP